jgi:hypothetical protein
MDLTWDTVLWSAIPVALLLLASVVTTYWLLRRRPFPMEESQVRVERAYIAARKAPGGRILPQEAAHTAEHVSVSAEHG